VPRNSFDGYQNPKDPLYRKYITPAKFAARYGANANDYVALKQWPLANG
jgi:hypothetical protein